jgi:hypothetical protein
VSRRRALVAAGGVATVASLVIAPAAEAHGLVGRADLPIPAWLFGWAAAIVLIVSFLALAVLWPTPRLQEPRGRRLFDMPGFVEPLCGLIGIALFVLVVYAGLAGSPLPTRNFTPTFVYVIFWVGLPILSGLLGDVFRAFSPWRAIARAAAWVAGRLGAGGSEPMAYPERLGRWPAAFFVLGFAWLELAYQSRSDPATLAWLALGYAVVQLIGMSLYGIETWSSRGDGFGALFGTYARLSPLERRGRTLFARPPLGGAPQLVAIPGTVALLCVAIGSTTFDGFSSGAVWNQLLPGLQRDFGHLGAGVATGSQWAATLGLVVCVALVSAFYVLGIRGMGTVGGGHRSPELRRSFAHTLIPIALAYAVAHYFSLLVYNGQAMGYLVSDPLGHGSNLLGTADATIDYGIINSTGIWYVQVGALVLGHVAGLALAHDRALAIYRDARDAVRSQAWMLVVMVGFTSLGLWLLSAVTT